MLERVRLVDFKSHVDTTVELGQLTVLVGPNASGKTSVLEALDILSWVCRAPLLQRFEGRLDRMLGLVRQGADGFTLEGSGGALGLRLEVPREAMTQPPGAVAMITITLDGQPRPAHSHLTMAAAVDARLRDAFSARYLKPSAAHLAEPTVPQDPTTATLDNNGRGLASVLANLKLSDDDAFRRVEEDLRAIIPRVQKIRIGREAVKNQLHEVVLFDFEDARGVPAPQASEGTVLVLGILAAAHAAPAPRVLLLDDLEKGLHPRAQVDLARLLKRLLERRTDLQIVLTTHSPYLLDEVEAEDVRVVAVGPDGAPRVAKLSDHPDAQHALQALTTGEFFSAESEDWVLAGEGPRA